MVLAGQSNKQKLERLEAALKAQADGRTFREKLRHVRLLPWPGFQQALPGVTASEFTDPVIYKYILLLINL